ncbi:HutD/Ves family protein [Acidocella aminolytica]|jgi:environmental stress-induced protein Ves|uniref:HutD family protein n=1 Tax=Acidocella aminolytica 101 = DSM 11237 TaxID=1120923 RepID=A0A0D6PL13_9PROT|nr:HutD family protein [Acidocella aminolytica]GAN82086.1 hypothetical protein Aam_152_006 [Acidocella aminolytica 101 = DSM 11237]SHF46952.1 hypothetical protein SAMN02746095_03370 [Acidocella aminolytica 101 = DSM 11237]
MMQLLPAAARIEVAWKNGGGVTSVVASAPGRLREFGWRLSLAEVSQAGAFSCFPGISRFMGILQGRLRLEVEGQQPVELSPAGPAFGFAGDAATHAAPVGGAVHNINLMFDPACFTASLDYEPEGIQRPACAAAYLMLTLGPMMLNGTALGALDAALLPSGEAVDAQGGGAWIAALAPAAP